MTSSALQVQKDNDGGPAVRAFRQAHVLSLADVQPEPLRWLWENRIPLGKLTIIDGDPGIGKSHLTMDIAARVSTGAAFFGGKAREPGDVLLLSAEDGLEDTIQPRLVAAGADLKRVHAFRDVIGPKGDKLLPSFPADADLLAREVQRCGAKLVVIDPLMAYLGSDVNSSMDQEVRRALAPLSRAAHDTRCSILLVRHLNKRMDTPALYRGGGSIGIVGAARAAFLLAVDPEDPDSRILVATKANLARLARGLKFRLADGTGGGARVVWGAECDLTAEDLLAPNSGEKDDGLLPELVDWLRAVLQEGPVQVQDIHARKKANNVPGSRRTLERAKKALGVRSERIGYQGPMSWSLPPNPAVPPVRVANGDNGRVGEYDQADTNEEGHTRHSVHTCQDNAYPEDVADLGPQEIAL